MPDFKGQAPLDRQSGALAASISPSCITLPTNISGIFKRDPRLIGFIAARHKFVAKILAGMDVLEVGCQEGFGTLFVSPYVKHITCIDFYPPFIEGFKAHSLPHMQNCEVYQHDVVAGSIEKQFDGIFALDVLEHIDPVHELAFWQNLSSSLATHGTMIVGMPSIESQVYASEASKAGHVNCKSGEELFKVASSHFHNVCIFSMNDEMLHNGYLPMSHYILVVCCSKR